MSINNNNQELFELPVELTLEELEEIDGGGLLGGIVGGIVGGAGLYVYHGIKDHNWKASSLGNDVAEGAITGGLASLFA